AGARQLARGITLQEVRFLDLGGAHEELEPVGEPGLPDVTAVLPDAVLVAFLELVRLEDALPPPGPPLGGIDRIPDALTVGLEQPGGEKSVLSHALGRRVLPREQR